MELFERIQLLKGYLGSYKKIYDVMGLRQQQFSSYLNPTSQKNLWEYLPKLTEAHPEISRSWLYWGEGEMLTSAKESSITPETRIELLNRELTEANRVLAETNKQLVEELLKRQ